jgi:hypothetical protein
MLLIDDLSAGNYTLLLVVDQDVHFGEVPTEATAEITVGDDGAVTPSRVTFAPKK